MSEDEKKSIVRGFCLVLVGIVLGILIGINLESRLWKLDAVKRGFAEYKVDESGSPVWQWKDAEKAESR